MTAGRDDTKAYAEVLRGAIIAAQHILATINGFDKMQRETLGALGNHLFNAKSKCDVFILLRERME